jgi:SAM-dependent methyltransferase
MDDADLLQAYLEARAPEAQRWNLSPESLFIEHTTREHLRRWLTAVGAVCNVGIGAGEWDDWLGYWLGERGTLTSIDVDAAVCERFAYRQRRERHPFPARVLCRSVLDVAAGPFDLITMIGSTLHEIGDHRGGLDACRSLLAPAGALFYMDFTAHHPAAAFEQWAAAAGLTVTHRAEQREYPELELYLFVARAQGRP